MDQPLIWLGLIVLLVVALALMIYSLLSRGWATTVIRGAGTVFSNVWYTLLAIVLAVVIGVVFWQLLQRLPRDRSDYFVVLVAPFRDTGGEVGQTGRSVAQELVVALDQQYPQFVVEPLTDAPTNAD